MEEIKSRYSTRESFISELAFAMSNHDIQEEQYLNLTQQNMSVILREDYSWGKKWPAEGDEVIFVDKTPSWEAFHLMEDFADSIADSRITKELYNVLEKRHPFSAFRYAEKVHVSFNNGINGVTIGRMSKQKNGCMKMV